MGKKASVKIDTQLHLVLEAKWYDKIERGEKPEEYRSFNDYWIKRLCILKGEEIIGVKDFATVKLHRGYTATHMIFVNDGIFIDTFENVVPAEVEKGSTVFTITLGEKLC
jgi:hypothetical protein